MAPVPREDPASVQLARWHWAGSWLWAGLARLGSAWLGFGWLLLGFRLGFGWISVGFGLIWLRAFIYYDFCWSCPARLPPWHGHARRGAPPQHPAGWLCRELPRYLALAIALTRDPASELPGQLAGYLAPRPPARVPS